MIIGIHSFVDIEPFGPLYLPPHARNLHNIQIIRTAKFSPKLNQTGMSVPYMETGC